MARGPSIFRQLLRAMLAFGAFVGVVFPVFARVVLDSERALTPLFFGMCIAAGLLVGAVNYALFSVVVSRVVKRLVLAMGRVNAHVASRECSGAQCADGMHLDVVSADALGDAVQSFNAMTDTIALRLAMEERIQAMIERLAASVEIQDVSTVILRSLAQVGHAPVGLLYAETQDGMRLQAHSGADQGDDVPVRLDTTQGCVQEALRGGEILLVSPEREGLDWVRTSTPLGSFRPGSLLLVPLMVSRQVVGLVFLAAARPFLSRPERELLEALRVQAAPHLQNAALHQRIKALAALDDLTGVLNRRFGLQRLGEEFSRSVRHGVPVSVLLLDVDHFKRFNDAHGHAAGDRVLQAVARAIDDSLRAGDVLCRYGGEEFLVLIPGTGVQDAAQLGERMRRVVAASEIPWGEQSLRVTVSLGQATWPITPASLPDELVSAADAALYQAKEAGRDRLMAHLGDRIVSHAELATGALRTGSERRAA